MNPLEAVGQALLRVTTVAIQVVVAAVGWFQSDLRLALERAGIRGDPATLLITLVPLLVLVAVVRLMGGLIRILLAAALIVVLLEILLPHLSPN